VKLAFRASPPRTPARTLYISRGTPPALPRSDAIRSLLDVCPPPGRIGWNTRPSYRAHNLGVSATNREWADTDQLRPEGGVDGGESFDRRARRGGFAAGGTEPTGAISGAFLGPLARAPSARRFFGPQTAAAPVQGAQRGSKKARRLATHPPPHKAIGPDKVTEKGRRGTLDGRRLDTHPRPHVGPQRARRPRWDGPLLDRRSFRPNSTRATPTLREERTGRSQRAVVEKSRGRESSLTFLSPATTGPREMGSVFPSGFTPYAEHLQARRRFAGRSGSPPFSTKAPIPRAQRLPRASTVGGRRVEGKTTGFWDRRSDHRSTRPARCQNPPAFDRPSS